MPIKVTLRKNRHKSPFRELLIRLLTSPYGDSSILCSGYIWQDNTPGKYNVLDDGLRSAIITGCATGKLITVAGKFSQRKYRYLYGNFVNDLVSNGVNVQALYAPQKNWHAKIAIRLSKKRPVAALIGSSNLTGPAYGINRGKWNWNYEADVLIWTPHRRHDVFFRNDGIEEPLGKFDTILDPELDQPSEEEQLNSIYDDVINAELEGFKQ